MSVLRAMTAADHDAVLALNAADVALLAPLDAARLRQLVGWADRAGVVDVDGQVAGFVLTFASGSAYDGENFAWFTAAYDDCYYLDRIVLAPHTRRRGVATQVYEELERDCRRARFCLEVNLEPPNEPSLAFHRGRGYVEVARRGEPGHVVAMLVKELVPSPTARGATRS